MNLTDIVSQFATEGATRCVRPLGEGFINDTYLVYVEGEEEPKYLLQTKNHKVFPDVPAMMDNILKVTGHIKAKAADPLRETLTIIPAKDGKLYFKDADGCFWAMCLFIRGTKSYFTADSPEMARQGGIGLGKFHKAVSDMKEPLVEIIKGFHNIRWRFTQWDESLKADKAGRVASLSEEIGWIESRRQQMLDFWSLYENGVIPTRITHNDTKISNFLFEAESGELLCAIDLDTAMSSTLLNDVGDALRSYTNTAAEDEPDLSKVSMSMDMYKAYIGGYLSQAGDALAPIEKDYLAFSGLYITFEQTLRFLMDYIDGDTYYKIAYPEHNLVRTHSQYALLTSMEEQYEKMVAFVKEQ